MIMIFPCITLTIPETNYDLFFILHLCDLDGKTQKKKVL